MLLCWCSSQIEWSSLCLYVRGPLTVYRIIYSRYTAYGEDQRRHHVTQRDVLRKWLRHSCYTQLGPQGRCCSSQPQTWCPLQLGRGLFPPTCRPQPSRWPVPWRRWFQGSSWREKTFWWTPKRSFCAGKLWAVRARRPGPPWRLASMVSGPLD